MRFFVLTKDDYFCFAALLLKLNLDFKEYEFTAAETEKLLPSHY